MGNQGNDAEPSLFEAWTMLGTRLGMTVTDHDKSSVRAEGTVDGRQVTVSISGAPPRSEFSRFFFGVSSLASRNRRAKWRSLATVSRSGSPAITGTVESIVDTNDPSWNPREFSPRNGRRVTADHPALQAALTPDLRDRLMNITADVRIEVTATELRLDHLNSSIPSKGAGYVAGSVLHHFVGTPPPWPERGLSDSLCEWSWWSCQ